MQKNLKDEILSAASLLFNERGYSDVSMRNIADALHISVGNLTYYFKKKEDLIEAVVLQQHRTYQKRSSPRTLRELNEFFTALLEEQKRNPYFFRHYTQLAQLCPHVYRMQRRVLQETFDDLRSALLHLQRLGLVRPDVDAAQLDGVVAVLLSANIRDVPVLDMGNDRDVLVCLWSVMKLLLTAEGGRAYDFEIRQRNGSGSGASLEA